MSLLCTFGPYNTLVVTRYFFGGFLFKLVYELLHIATTRFSCSFYQADKLLNTIKASSGIDGTKENFLVVQLKIEPLRTRFSLVVPLMGLCNGITMNKSLDFPFLFLHVCSLRKIMLDTKSLFLGSRNFI